MFLMLKSGLTVMAGDGKLKMKFNSFLFGGRCKLASVIAEVQQYGRGKKT